MAGTPAGVMTGMGGVVMETLTALKEKQKEKKERKKLADAGKNHRLVQLR